MKEQKLKSSNAITLIALIITIIVLLILAMVSIKLIWDGGIITHAKNATNRYTIEQEKEQINLGYADYKMAKTNGEEATLTIDGEQVRGTGPWEIHFNKTGNEYTLTEEGTIEGPIIKTEDDLAMEKYVLGEDLKGQNLNNLMDETGEKLKQLNGEDVELLTSAFCNYTKENEEVQDACFYMKYKNKIYKIKVDDVYTTKDVKMVYEAKGREGQKIEYSYDGTEENKKEWTILYDNGDNVEIISPDVVGSLTLGSGDKEAQGNNDLEKAVDSYNHAIERINNYTSSLVTNTNQLRVRSVGSNPENPNSRNTSKYTSEGLAKWKFQRRENNEIVDKEVSLNGIAERSDNNFEQDFVRMLYWGIKQEDACWTASRTVMADLDATSEAYGPVVQFGVLTFFTQNGMLCTYLDNPIIDTNTWTYPGAIKFGNVYGKTESFSVRPVVKISEDLINQ